MKRLFITIDTEMDADIYWAKGNPVRFTSVMEGIPQIYRPIWSEYSIRPIYFVSPEVVDDYDCCEVLKKEISQGAIIGAHLHPEYIAPLEKSVASVVIEEFPCFGCSTQVEKEKIYNLKKLIRKNLGVDTVWYRAARFGADNDTIRILDELGFKYDSSFTPMIDWRKKGGPDHSGVSLVAYNIYSSITEYPVTISGKRFGAVGKFLPDNWLFYRWLRPTHMTYFEQKRLIQDLNKKNVQDLIMMFHSMEVMINRTPYVRSKSMQRYFVWRLKKTIQFAQAKGYYSYDIPE